MKIRVINKRKMSTWSIAYAMYYLSLFLEDLPTVTFNLIPLLKGIRYVSYFLFLVIFIHSTQKYKKSMLFILTVFLFSIFLYFFTNDMYYAAISIIILDSANKNPEMIIRESYYLLIIFSVITVFGALIGVIPMINSPRTGTTEVRLGLGFYHSNVLPLIFVYLIIYKLMLDSKKLRKKVIFLWAITGGIIFYFCNSNNGLLSLSILILLFLLYKDRDKGNNILFFLSKHSVIILTALSLFMTLIQGRGLNYAFVINQWFSGRFAIAYHQIQRSGLVLVNLMGKSDYAAVAGVLDNGYIYVMLRYGMLFILLYWLIHVMFSKKYKEKSIYLCVSIVVSIANMIDNDLFSYGYLPFILLAFNNNSDFDLKRGV